jgi:hypothetical protein
MDIAIMIEGQNGLNWPRWQRLARAVEDLGFAGLYRSDHFTNSDPPDLDSLELWTSLTWLATHTQRIEFGSLVSPASFRDPRMTARIARDPYRRQWPSTDAAAGRALRRRVECCLYPRRSVGRTQCAVGRVAAGTQSGTARCAPVADDGPCVGS